MQGLVGTCLIATAPSGAKISIWTTTAAEAKAVTEALHDARPLWQVSIAGQARVFSCDGKIVGLVARTSIS